MKICKLCGSTFRNFERIRGKVYCLKNRSYCLSCSPFKANNRTQLYRIKFSPKCRCGRVLRKDQKACSLRCRQNDVQDKWVRRYLSGEWDGARKCHDKAISPKIRDFLMDMLNHKCQLCGWSKKNVATGRVPLNIHHIDGNSTNHALDNVQLICPNCHAITPNWKSLNKKNLRLRKAAVEAIQKAVIAKSKELFDPITAPDRLLGVQKLFAQPLNPTPIAEIDLKGSSVPVAPL